MVKISACVIVKNEAENIIHWLNCVKKIADEIIVVDTGSADDTAKIARAAGADVYSFVWCNDFSKAKNYALDQATGDWIIFMDADEYIQSSDCLTVRQLIIAHHKEKNLAGYMCRLVNIDRDTRENLGSSFYQVRIFRRHPSIRFVGSIHECLHSSSATAPKEMRVYREMIIYHTGYSRAIIQEKLSRNLKLILAAQQERGEKPMDAFYLADCYYGLGEYEKVCYYAQKMIDSGQKAVGQENRPWSILIQSMMLLHYPLADIRQKCQAARKKYPAAAEYYFLQGTSEWEYHDYIAAEASFRKGLAVYEKKNEGQLHITEDGALGILPGVYLHLGQILIERGCKEEGNTWYLKGLQLHPYTESLLQAFVSQFSAEESVDVIAILNHIYDKEKDAAFIVRTLLTVDVPAKIVLYYDHQAGSAILGEFERYFYAGNHEAASALVLDDSESLRALGAVCEKQSDPGIQSVMHLFAPALRNELKQENNRKRIERLEQYMTDGDICNDK